MTFTDIRISNDSASKLWALENSNIHIIDMSNQTISGVLVSDVEQFTNNKDVIGYVSLESDKEHDHRKINIFKEGEKGSTTIHEFEEKKPKSKNIYKFLFEVLVFINIVIIINLSFYHVQVFFKNIIFIISIIKWEILPC